MSVLKFIYREDVEQFLMSAENVDNLAVVKYGVQNFTTGPYPGRHSGFISEALYAQGYDIRSQYANGQQVFGNKEEMLQIFSTFGLVNPYHFWEVRTIDLFPQAEANRWQVNFQMSDRKARFDGQPSIDLGFFDAKVAAMKFAEKYSSDHAGSHGEWVRWEGSPTVNLDYRNIEKGELVRYQVVAV